MDSSKQNIFFTRSKGFSLIELIIVIVMVGVFVAIAGTRTHTGLSTFREKVAIDQITSDIDLANKKNLLNKSTRIKIDEVIKQIKNLIPNNPKPKLLHGDLWEGNILFKD